MFVLPYDQLVQAGCLLLALTPSYALLAHELKDWRARRGSGPRHELAVMRTIFADHGGEVRFDVRIAQLRFDGAAYLGDTIWLFDARPELHGAEARELGQDLARRGAAATLALGLTGNQVRTVLTCDQLDETAQGLASDPPELDRALKGRLRLPKDQRLRDSFLQLGGSEQGRGRLGRATAGQALKSLAMLGLAGGWAVGAFQLLARIQAL